MNALDPSKAPTPSEPTLAKPSPVDVISIQSQVVYGCVGNNAALPILIAAGYRVVAVPTVILSNTPHYETLHGGALPIEWFKGLLQGLDERGVTQGARAILCGYLGEAAQAEALAQWLPQVRARHPSLKVFIDPVMGDRNDGLYVDPGLVSHYREKLLPLADGLTPNHFELELLAGRTLSSMDEVIVAAQELLNSGPQWIVVTSAAPSAAAAGTLQVAVVTREDVTVFSHRHISIPDSVKGTGDVLTADLVARILGGQPLVQAAQQACARITQMLERTRLLGWEELALQG